jgi:HEPN domain-containing protein
MFKGGNILPDETINQKPPKGMKTVMCDNKPVGYVKDTGDPQKNAMLAKELLIEKGLWREIPITESMYNQATSFANTANHIYEKDLKKLPRNPQGIAPFVVNAAFSAEMYLKCLQKMSGEPSQTHTLTALHKQLPNKVKDKINKYTKQLEPQYEVERGMLFKEYLKNINNAFVNWRYIFEKKTEYVHIPTTIFVLHVLHQVAVEELNIGT